MKNWRIISISPLIFLMVFLLTGLSGTVPAKAQEGGRTSFSTKCLVCHEDLYYQHDIGKSFCMCEEEMTCTCCHGGNDQAVDIESAHMNMTLRPITDDASVCQQCHTEDYQQKAARFAAIAGISPSTTNSPISNMVYKEPVAINPDLGLHDQKTSVWYIGLEILAGVLFVLVVFFGYRCWRADCLARKQLNME